MKYTFDNVIEIIDGGKLNRLMCVIDDKPLQSLQFVFDEMKKVYIAARNLRTETILEDYGEIDGIRIMDTRYPKPVNIDELANQARIISNKYEIYGTTLRGKVPGFIVKIPNVRVRVRTYCNLGDYYCWIQKWAIDKFALRIYQAMPNEKGHIIFGGSSSPHPHISGDGPCLGGFEGPIKNAVGHFNMVGTISNIKKYLHSYYGRSTFSRVGNFRPLKINTLPIKLLKKLPAQYPHWDSYFKHAFKDNEEKRPHYSSKAYDNLYNKYKANVHDKIEVIEVMPNKADFYIRHFNGIANGMGAQITQKVLITKDYFNIDNYWHMFAALVVHAKKLAGKTIAFGTKYEDYASAWDDIKKLCIDNARTIYHFGYLSTRLHPDIKMDDTGLTKKAFAIYDIIHPREGNEMSEINRQTCKEFTKYISKYKTIDDFINPKNNYDERKDMVLKMIDKLYPEVLEWQDSFKRKIILTLDKQKRRMLNEINNPISNSNANQLSFEEISKD